MNITDKNILLFKKWYITDCVVRNRNYFHFITRNTKESHKASAIAEDTVTKSEVGIYLDSPPDDCISYLTFNNMGQLYVGSSTYDKYDEVVCIDDHGNVYARNSEFEGIENNIPKSIDGPRRGIITKIKKIFDRLYFVGTTHSVGYRKGVSDWQSLCLNLPIPDNERDVFKRRVEFNLRDIDGFSHDDLYIAGGKGNVWHFTGTEWEKVHFPSNVFLETVCCAGDGSVYIGGQSGILFKGRGNKWKEISSGGYSLPFKDIVWHAGKVWCTSDYGLWHLENDMLVNTELSPELAVAAGNLSVGDGVMLMAGMYGAAWHDGLEWHSLLNTVELQSDEDDNGSDDADDYDEEHN